MSFKVYNPSAGRWFVLHWWTEDDRGHLTFAKTTDGLCVAARAVFEKEPEAENRGLYEIEMVAPSARMEKLAALHDRKEAIDQFYYELSSRVRLLLGTRLRIPLPFERCKTYEPEEFTDVTDENNRKHHYSCKNCDMTLRLVGVTRDELYEKHFVRWRLLNPLPRHSPGRKQPVRSLSLAAPAADDEKIWFAYGNFGHHAGGIELHKVDLAEAEAYRPQCLSDQALFFCLLVRRVTGQTASAITKAISETKAAYKKRCAEDESRRKKEQEEEERKRIQVVLDFFETKT